MKRHRLKNSIEIFKAIGLLAVVFSIIYLWKPLSSRPQEKSAQEKAAADAIAQQADKHANNALLQHKAVEQANYMQKVLREKAFQKYPSMVACRPIYSTTGPPVVFCDLNCRMSIDDLRDNDIQIIERTTRGFADYFRDKTTFDYWVVTVSSENIRLRACFYNHNSNQMNSFKKGDRILGN